MPYFILVLLGSIWGASYLFIKVGGETIPPITFVLGRVAFAGVTLFVIMLARRERMPALREPVWRWLAAMGLLNSVIPYTLITWGETRVSSGVAAILVGTMPIFTVLLAHWLTEDEKLSSMKVAGMLLGFLGVVVLFLPDLAQGATFNLVGGLAIVLAAVSYAFASIQARKHLRGFSHTMVALGQMIVATLILMPMSLLVDQPWTLQPSLLSIASLLTLAIVGTALAYLMYYWLIENMGATRTSLVTYISPVIAVFLGVIVLNEPLDWTVFVGLAGIIAGVVLVTLKRSPTAVPVVTAEEV